MKNMKAIRVHSYGGPEVLKLDEVPVPVPAADEVLIRVIAAAVNPLDCKIRSGQMREMMPLELPYVAGGDGSGIVEAVGAEVTKFQPGNAVFAFLEVGRSGSFAEYFTIKAAHVAHKPRTVSFIEAAALPMISQTAWLAMIKVGEIAEGQRVLIHGASGGVGSMAVQLAKWRGAYVIGTGSGSSRTMAESLGVDEFIDYRTTAFADVVSNVDVVLDTLGGTTQEASWGVLRPGGLLIATAQPPSPERAKAAGVRATFIHTPPSGEVLEQIAALVDTGKLRAPVGAEFSLAEAVRAHELMESGRSSGKIVLYVGKP